MDQSSVPAEVDRALALIEKGHELEGQQLTAEDTRRVHRILSGELPGDDARIEMHTALRALVERERER